MDKSQEERICEVIKDCIRKKLKEYRPESNNMPFHYRLLGKDRKALFSFIQSLNTMFGTSIFEPVAEILASKKFPFAQRQFQVGDIISRDSLEVIQDIINKLSAGASPDKIK